MSFEPHPVLANDAKTHQAEWKKAGYRLMDNYLKENGSDGAAPFLLFLAGVADNIYAHPNDDKYRKLKKASKAYGAVAKIKGSNQLMDWLGFRSQVLEFQEWMVLRTSDADWLDEFRAKVALIQDTHAKAKSAEVADKRSAAAKEEEAREHKAKLKAQIDETRHDAMQRRQESAKFEQQQQQHQQQKGGSSPLPMKPK